ncbi:hypothetical protein SmJEL517_g00957 [Synchytrium microbalum]|uniref:Carboxymuconolactone decarboxylase-like domain-containing protein n=1 Tax=Synchytrium microbalum TaxID=1806994 RepID=A0A507CHB3_9FUNG|nr:uncharacterized protein SmJEL517_g00957 [Synchytrium microbalum]TPX36953.1 hypothetical protein SmJEL517_g00957 [Synchytrium microbalum]
MAYPRHGLRFGEINETNGTAEEVAAIKKIGRIVGPMNAVLRVPQYAINFSRMGDFFFKQQVIPRDVHELAIIYVGRHWNAQFEWFAHRAIAIKEGLPAHICDAIEQGRRPENMNENQRIVYDFTAELIQNKGVSDKTYAEAKAKFGEKGIIHLIGVIAFYTSVCMVLNVDKFPVPEGVTPMARL